MTDHPSLKMDPDKRGKLYAVAIDEFVSHGFARASLNRIVKEVGMSKSSYYHFFANKADLFQQIIEQNLQPFAELWTHFDLDGLKAENFWSSMFDVNDSTAGLIAENPQLIAMGRMFWKSRENIEEQQLTSDMIEKSKQFFLDLLKRGQELEVIRIDLPDSMIVAAVMGLAMSLDQWAIENFDKIVAKDLAKYNELSLDIIVRMLSPKE